MNFSGRIIKNKWISDIASGENITELMVAEGWLTVRRESIRGESNLPQLEDAAKSQCKVHHFFNIEVFQIKFS